MDAEILRLALRDALGVRRLLVNRDESERRTPEESRIQRTEDQGKS